MKVYNECFYKMRKALGIEPINFYSDYSQIKDKINGIFLYLQNGVIAGAVSCYGNELDDLIVEKSFQGQGVGQKLLLWGMNHIKEQGREEIILHVAEWNQNAVKLYLKTGFCIKKKEKVQIYKTVSASLPYEQFSTLTFPFHEFIILSIQK